MHLKIQIVLTVDIFQVDDGVDLSGRLRAFHLYRFGAVPEFERRKRLSRLEEKNIFTCLSRVLSLESGWKC